MGSNRTDWGHGVLHSLFGAEARVAVLTQLLQRPDDPVHTRELARRSGLTPNQTYQQLRRLEGIGLLRSRMVGRSRVYQVDQTFPLFVELRRIILKTTGLAGCLREALRDLPIEVAFIFGSVATGEDRRESDVDLMVVGQVSGRALAAATGPVQSEVGRPINAVLFSAQEFREKAQARDPFLTGALDGPKILVKGEIAALQRLAE